MTPRIRLTNTTAAFITLTLCGAASAFTGGAPEGFNASPASFGSSCVDCHASFLVNSGPGSITILDLPALYVPSQTYTLRVRIEDPAKVGAGFELSVEDPTGVHLGQLAITDPINTHSAGAMTPIFVTHTSTGIASSIADWAAMGNAAEFAVQWQAPSSDMGDVGFYAAGAAINDGTASSNDDVYTIAEIRSAAASGDLNGDGAVDTADLGLLLAAFGTTDPVADINNDGIVDTADLGLLLGVFGS